MPARRKHLEPDGDTTESTAIEEDRDDISDDANNVYWGDVERCMQGMEPCEKAKVDPRKTDMDASIHIVLNWINRAKHHGSDQVSRH